MMDVRVMRVAVALRLMLVRMRVRLLAVPVEGVPVPVMLVVRVGVVVRQRLVPVQVMMMFGEMEDYVRGYQDCCDPEKRVRSFAEQPERQGGADKGRGGEIRAGSRGAQVPQPHHEQHQAHAVPEQSHEGRRGRELRRRQRGPERRRNTEAYGPGDQNLDRSDLRCVAGGYPAGEIVVDRPAEAGERHGERRPDRKSTRLNSSHMSISYAVFCL